ncbi:MAG: hypothetical protein O2779_04805 [Nanoarchaeota archaeon]|nr:hypothetical protein [Nanoarchaeota archaeon]
MEKLPNKEFREMVPTLREKGFYEHQEQRQIQWPEYSLSQIQDAKETIAFIRASTETCRTLDLIGKEGRPLTDPKDLTKAILLSEFLGKPEHFKNFINNLHYLSVKEIAGGVKNDCNWI